jgi:hypothetical protein
VRVFDGDENDHGSDGGGNGNGNNDDDADVVRANDVHVVDAWGGRFEIL